MQTNRTHVFLSFPRRVFRRSTEPVNFVRKGLAHAFIYDHRMSVRRQFVIDAFEIGCAGTYRISTTSVLLRKSAAVVDLHFSRETRLKNLVGRY